METQANTPAAQGQTKKKWYERDWVVAITYAVLVRFFGVLGSLCGIGAYYGLRKRIGHWPAVGVSLALAWVATALFAQALLSSI